MKRLVMGILAHVDSGKTTLSEAMLYKTGSLRKLGRVDHGDSYLDTDAQERARGITIFSKQAVLKLKDTEITLLDTPGHVDFSPEMERTLQVLDYAILVISGPSGVQNHTETLWELLEQYHIPTFIFVNKMDQPGVEKEKVLEELEKGLSGSIVDFTLPKEELYESLAMCSENLMAKYLETGALEQKSIVSAIADRMVFPCWFGSALKLEGVEELMTALETYTRTPARWKAFGAKVFKIGEDPQGGRLTYMKITGGSLKNKTVLTRPGDDGWSEKINQIRLYSGAKFQLVEEALPGMVCAVTGLTMTRPGMGLGTERDSDEPALEPVLSYRLVTDTDTRTALQNLRKLEQEEPQLHVNYIPQTGQIHVSIMGEVQLEILRGILYERFGMTADFAEGSIMYRETIAEPVEGVGHFEPLRHYAEVHLLLEPAERGSGLTFATAVPEDKLDRNWQRLILTHLMEKTHVGVLTGSPITDMKLTLIAGKAHLKHTEGGDFRQATYRAVRQGLRSGKSVLLEPWYSFKLEMPTENIGRAMTDLQNKGASFAPPETRGDKSLITGQGPVAALMGYQEEITEYTRGRGRLSCMPAGYRECADTQAVIEAMGYDSDHDLENTADSVFCSHGSSDIIPWDQVRDHMHIDTGFGRETSQEEPPKAATGPAEPEDKYKAMMAADAELMKIFERTYGAIKKDTKTAFRSVKKASSGGKAGKAAPQKGLDKPEYMLVDGYNIIFAWEDLKKLSQGSLDGARARLADILCSYQAWKQNQVILVFDAYKVKGNPGSVEKYHNIHIVYTKEAETADMYIEKVTHQLAQRYRVRVATSDGLEQIIVLGHGALRVSAASFRQEVDEAISEIRGFLS